METPDTAAEAEREYENGLYEVLRVTGARPMDDILGKCLAVRDTYMKNMREIYDARMAEISRMSPSYNTVVCEEGHHTRVDELLGDPNSADWICPHCFIRADKSQRERWSFPSRWVAAVPAPENTGELWERFRLHRWRWHEESVGGVLRLECSSCWKSAAQVELFSVCEMAGE